MNNRRSFLKKSALGAGALAFSPSFNHLLGAPQAQGEIPHRFIFIRKSNGNRPKEFTLPTFSEKEQKLDKGKKAFEADLDKHELPIWMRCLEGHKENVTMLHGLSVHMVSGGHFSFSGCMGAYNVGRDLISRIKRTTVDFELAKLFPSPFGHVELSMAGNMDYTFRKGIISGYSAPAPNQRNYAYADPQTAYDELFKSVLNPSAVASDNKLLKHLQEQERKNLKDLGGKERMKISNQVNSIQAIRDRNKKVSTLSDVISKSLPTINKIHANGGPNANTPEKCEAFTDILLSALISGLTNVITYTIDDLPTPIIGLKGNEGDRISIHEVGHNGSFSGVSPDTIRTKIKTMHMEQVNKIVTTLKSVPEGKGTMFDNTTIIYMPESGAGHHGPNTEAPTVVLSGANSKLDIAGRYIRLPLHATEGHKTLSNWYTTLLNSYGNPIAHYGDLDIEMSRKKMPQLGNIKQLMV